MMRIKHRTLHQFQYCTRINFKCNKYLFHLTYHRRTFNINYWYTQITYESLHFSSHAPLNTLLVAHWKLIK